MMVGVSLFCADTFLVVLIDRAENLGNGFLLVMVAIAAITCSIVGLIFNRPVVGAVVGSVIGIAAVVLLLIFNRTFHN